MSLFGSGGGSVHAPKLAGIQIQSSSYGRPIPIVFGTTRLAGQIIWADDFKKHAEETTTGKVAVEKTKYSASIILALCEGPIIGVQQVWADKKKTFLAKYNFTVSIGSLEQGPPGWLVIKHPTKALGYSGTALAASNKVNLGTSGILKNFNFELRGFRSIQTPTPGGPDANPVDVIMDLVTDPFVGLGLEPRIFDPFALPTGRGEIRGPRPLADIPSVLRDYRDYCTAAALWLSPAILDQKAASEHLADILMATGSEAVWSAGLIGPVLKIVPYADTDISANGVDYVANKTPIYDLGPDDFITSRGDDAAGGHADAQLEPIQIKVRSMQDTFNITPVRFRDRAADYNESEVDDPDNADVEAFGDRRAAPVELLGITRQSHALYVSRLLAHQSLYDRREYTFTLSWRYALLEPMDLVTLTTIGVDNDLALDHHPVRIIAIEEDDEGALTFTCMDWPAGAATATLYSTEAGVTGEDQDADPGPVAGSGGILREDPDFHFEPVVFLIPREFSSARPGEREIGIALSGSTELWGGCNVWGKLQDADEEFRLLGTIEGPAIYGIAIGGQPDFTLSTDPGEPDPDLDVDTDIHIQLALFSPPLLNGSEDQREGFFTLCWLEGQLDDDGLHTDELLSYESAILIGSTAPNTGPEGGDEYILSRFRRAIYASNGDSLLRHGDLRIFVRLDDSVFRLTIPEGWLANTLVFKFQSFNIFGGGLEDLSTVMEFEYSSIDQFDALRPPQSVTITPGDSDTTVEWEFTRVLPAGRHLGFRVVLFPDGENAENYASTFMTSVVRSLIFPVVAGTGTRAAVQAVYYDDLLSDFVASDPVP